MILLFNKNRKKKFDFYNFRYYSIFNNEFKLKFLINVFKKSYHADIINDNKILNYKYNLIRHLFIKKFIYNYLII